MLRSSIFILIVALLVGLFCFVILSLNKDIIKLSAFLKRKKIDTEILLQSSKNVKVISTGENVQPSSKINTTSLKSYGLINELTSKNINLKDLISYENFLNKLNNSDFVITDGDGVTEECYILGVPTLVWRYEHLDSNHLFGSETSLFLSEFDMNKCLDFFNNYKSYQKDRKVDNNSPSNEALDKILDKQNNL